MILLKINRKELVERHFPIITKLEPLSPLSVGNGEFAFTADITGLQTFPIEYDVPLGTQSQWGWHSTGGRDVYSDRDIEKQALHTYGRDVHYARYPEDKGAAYHWLRQNPHRLHLGQLSFLLLKENGEQVEFTDLLNTKQELNLWEGSLLSAFQIEDQPVIVKTVCHPNQDEIAVKVTSTLIEKNRLSVVLKFPSPHITSNRWEDATELDYQHDERHQTIIVKQSDDTVIFQRNMDEDQYEVAWTWSNGTVTETKDHEYILKPDGKNELQFTVAFAQQSAITSNFDATFHASKQHWKTFWTTGGAIDFSESTDARAHELERRVVLSQFLTAIHCAGSLPPQETGLMYNSWYGKFHLEMHWWHAAQFPLWGRAHLLAKSMDWYTSILPLAKELAQSQGYTGARWPKMVGPDGKQSPSEIAVVLIWQQPHPIAMAELCYQTVVEKEEALHRWKEIVFESAEFMASFAVWDEKKSVYVLGPPLIPAQENHRPEDSLNPPFELEYWKYGLDVAIEWKRRLDEEVPAHWLEVASQLAEPPHNNEVYLAHENCPESFTKYNHDHPSMVGALGILPGKMIDRKIMQQTLQTVKTDWQWETSWGWDFPMCAMTAARLGEGQMAVDFLLMDAVKNTYLPNGHNYQHANLTAYLPGNGGLLTAVAMMACGWQGAPHIDAPGFPQDGSWKVKSEGLHRFI
ncbi:glycoside hydrolase family 65 [Bacillus sp. FJAT-50079]|uniref:glycoside hydrolase family 65 n=1 Tax=Bacillus sp. FJAT-50079 TaxID=2833577 RepID=UPI001BC9D9F9|nr:glycoside hydrolase family 65 [Bacillus sp. FJAT-50079]MBS4208194.1 glycoside hydrolase family 65 [Bacillus sp. FJAT-50079]